MKINAFTCLLFGLLAVNLSYAQEKSPLVKGDVDISIRKGTIACHLFLSDLPTANYKDYVLRLNAGMNVRYFKGKYSNEPLDFDNEAKDSIGSGETQAYYFHEHPHNIDRFWDDQLEIKYLGMFNVVPDSASGYMSDDWRGNIAFNGYSVRADGLQGCWAPVVYNMRTHKQYTEVRYNLTISCNDCNVLFVNGSAPQRAKKATFVSDVPYELSIYCGKFKAVQNNGIWLLNSGMSKTDGERLFNVANSYQQYYTQHFHIPFKGSHTFIQTDAVANPKAYLFSFNSSPTTFHIGPQSSGLAHFFDKDEAVWHKKVMAHELAHYYFGTLLKTDVEFSHVINEGFAEYLALTITRDIEGASSYKEVLKDRMDELKYLHHYKPLAKAQTESDYGNREYYLYYYTPIVLTAIEKEIGADAMWQWLRAMLNTKPQHVDYNFMLSTFKTVVTDKALQDRIVNDYFDSDKAMENAIAKIGAF